jgi:hypothetical protein
MRRRRTLSHAEDAGCSITNPDTQANALAEVAMALARAGEASSAFRVAAPTSVAGHWTTAVRPVLLLVPTAFTALAHALAEQQLRRKRAGSGCRLPDGRGQVGDRRFLSLFLSVRGFRRGQIAFVMVFAAPLLPARRLAAAWS